MGQSAEEARVRRNYLISLVVSLVIVVSGMAWTLQVGRQSNQLYHQVYHRMEYLEGLREVAHRAEAHRP